MEVEKRKIELEKKDSEIVYSNAIKAGRRIYYLDVKKSRNEDLYLAITESKKKSNGNDENSPVSFEKHKIFLYKEDFDKFVEGLEDVIGFIKREQGEPISREEYYASLDKKTAEAAEPTAEAAEPTEENEVQATETKRSFFDKFKF